MRRAILALAALFGAACQSYGVLYADVQHDQAADFANYRSFAHAEVDAASMGLTGTRARILQDWIGESLRAKGLVAVPIDRADLLVAFAVGSTSRTEVWDWEARWYADPGVSVTEYREGRIVIDIADRRSEKVVWRGSAHQETMDSEFSDDRARAAVDRLLAEFPPGPASAD